LDDSSHYLLILAILVLFQTVLALAYAALNNMRQTTLKDRADEGQVQAQRALRLLDARSKLSLSYFLCRTLITVAITVFLTVYILPFITSLDSLASVELALVTTILVTGFLLVIMTDVVPEGVGSQYSEALFSFSVRVLRILVLFFNPLTTLLLGISRGIASLFGGSEMVNTVTEEEIMTLVSAGHTDGTIETGEKDMIYSILQLNETWVRELMTPRIDIVALDVDSTVSDALTSLIESGFSRIPVYDENIDDLIGILYAKDLLELWQKGQAANGHAIRELLRPAYFIPETKRASELLRELQSRNVHMAIVVDEYGGTAGLITIENLIEEIVGDIRDEYDQNEEDEYTQNGDDEYVIDGMMNIDDFNMVTGLELEDEEYDTIGGYVNMALGRLPRVGDTIDTDAMTLEVRELDGRRVKKVWVKIKAKEQEQAEQAKDEVVETPAPPPAEDTAASSPEPDSTPTDATPTPSTDEP
jgi:putative hemolysin